MTILARHQYRELFNKYASAPNRSSLMKSVPISNLDGFRRYCVPGVYRVRYYNRNNRLTNRMEVPKDEALWFDVYFAR